MFFVASKFSISNLCSISKIFIETSYIPVRNYAARKGTRERKQKKKVKKEVEEKVKFIPHNLRNRDLLLASRKSLKFDDSNRPDAIDDVYCMPFYRWKIYSFQEAINSHRQTHHPDMYNEPNADVQVKIELNMQGEKATRFIDDFTRVVAIPHRFEHGEERPIIAFSKTVSVQKEALDAGAELVGGVDLIKQIQNGGVSLQNFKYIIAHPDILPELVSLRGLMKRRFPNPKLGTLDVDLGTVTERFLHGISYSAKKDEYEKDFGVIETIIGSLNMESRHLEENFAVLIKDLNTMKPKREGTFISRCLLLSRPSPEKFKINHEAYLKVETTEDDEEPIGERVAL